MKKKRAGERGTSAVITLQQRKKTNTAKGDWRTRVDSGEGVEVSRANNNS